MFEVPIITDIDGCVSPKRWAALDLESLEKLKSYRIFFASGRSQPYMECLSQTVNNRESYIVENGSAIFSSIHNEYVWVAPTVQELARVREEIVYRLNSLGALTVKIEPGKDFSISCALYSSNKSLISMDESTALIEDRLSDLTGVSIMHSNSAVDITAAGVSKGRALQVLSDIEGFDLSTAYGFGDAENDLSFLSLVGTSGCPSNALPSVKAQVSYCSAQPDILGLLDFLGQIPNK